jgi:hypothetical protein
VEVEVEVVINRGSVPLPRTQANAGEQESGGGKRLLPSAAQRLFAAVTMERRRSFNPFCKDTEPWDVLAASAETAEQVGAADKAPYLS